MNIPHSYVSKAWSTSMGPVKCNHISMVWGIYTVKHFEVWLQWDRNNNMADYIVITCIMLLK